MGEIIINFPDGEDPRGETYLHINDPIMKAEFEATMGDIKSNTVMGGRVEGDDLILTTNGGGEVLAGGVRGEPGPKGSDGSNVLPTDEAIAQAINTPGAAQDALNATFVGLSDSALRLRRLRKPFQTSLVSDFRTGHGWTQATVGGGTNANDTSVFATGSQSFKVVTDGAGGGAFIEKTGLTVDLTGKALRVRFKLGATETEHLKTKHLIVYAGDSALDNHFQWTIMDNTAGAFNAPGYHYTTGAEWVEVTLPFAAAITAGTPNRAAITHVRLRASDNGSSLPITVWWDAVEVVEDETAAYFPNGVVTFAFDDNTETQWSEGVTRLAAKGMKGTIFVIGDTVGTAGFMTKQQLIDAQNIHGFEIACHSHTLADHSSDFRNLTGGQLAADIRGIRRDLASGGFKGIEHVAYPKGAYSRRTLPIIATEFTSGRTTVRPGFHETLPPGDPYRVRTLQVFNTDSVANVKAQIDRCYEKKSWLILTWHIIRTPATASTMYLPASFQEIVDYVALRGVDVLPYGEVLSRV